MALDTNIAGGGSGTKAEVTTANRLKVELEADAAGAPASVGGVRTFSENDPGAVTGTAVLRSSETSDDFRLRVGVDTFLFKDTFNGLTQNTSQWAYAFVVLTAAQPGAGTVNFSAVQGTTAAHGAFMRTFQYFPVFGTAQLWHEATWGMATAPLVANEVWSCGFGIPGSAILRPTDGAWFQLTTAGLIGRLCYNGVFTDSGVLLAFGDITVGELHKHSIKVSETSVEWWRNDILLGTTDIPAGNGQPFSQGALPAFMMKHNTGAVSNTNTMRVADITITLGDLATSKPWGEQLVSGGYSAYLGQNGHTQGKTSWWTNSVAPTAAAATNTAPIAGATTLGGLVAVLPTLAANTDGILFSYQNPASTINITGRNLVITGVRVQGAVSVVLTGGPVVYAYALAFGHTAASLATAETASFATATTHAPRVAFIGMETYAATAAVGTLGGSGHFISFDSPIVVRPGEFVALIARNMGVVTSAGAITVGCNFNGYWE